jgi:hypothetical protein
MLQLVVCHSVCGRERGGSLGDWMPVDCLKTQKLRIMSIHFIFHVILTDIIALKSINLFVCIVDFAKQRLDV